MIDLVTKENRHMFPAQLEQMWQQRHYAFVEKLGWDLDCKNGLEFDDYDTEDTVYILATLDGESIVGSMRLLPTTGRHLMGDLFPSLCDDGVPQGPDIWESSRTYVLAPAPELRRPIGGELICGMLEFALLYGVSKITFVVDMSYLPRVLEVGWNVEPLGLPRKIGDETLVAYALHVTPTALQIARHSRDILEPVIRFQRSTVAA